MHYWGLNEIATVAILGLEPDINKLWRDNEKGYDNYLQNYPQLKPMMKILKDIYMNKNDFFDYLERAIQVINSPKYLSKNLLY